MPAETVTRKWVETNRSGLGCSVLTEVHMSANESSRNRHRHIYRLEQYLGMELDAPRGRCAGNRSVTCYSWVGCHAGPRMAVEKIGCVCRKFQSGALTRMEQLLETHVFVGIPAHPYRQLV